MGRKRNQGKARRAAKAKARDEAEVRENNNQVINQAMTDGPRLMRQLQADDGEKNAHMVSILFPWEMILL